MYFPATCHSPATSGAVAAPLPLLLGGVRALACVAVQQQRAWLASKPLWWCSLGCSLLWPPDDGGTWSLQQCHAHAADVLVLTRPCTPTFVMRFLLPNGSLLSPRKEGKEFPLTPSTAGPKPRSFQICTAFRLISFQTEDDSRVLIRG